LNSISVVLIINSILLGVGLAMDAFSVSLANGLNEPDMKKNRMCLIAGVFAIFQAVMPLTGWVCVHTIVQVLTNLQKFIPWIALILLCYIGGKMIMEGIKGDDESKMESGLNFGMLMVQGVATSIDALSVGFTISEYGFLMAFTAAIIIAAVTFIICFAGLELGKKFGTKLAGKANILGGVILICIGIEILVSSFL